MSEVPLIGSYSKGQVAIVAERHLQPTLSMGEWVARRGSNGAIYAILSERGRGPRPAKVHMHVVCWELEHGPVPEGLEIDHIDPSLTLNNDVDRNLRLATRSQQCQNRRVQSISTCGFKGVTWHKQCQKWMVQIKEKGVRLHHSLWTDLELAARFYDVLALQLWGERAQTNFPRSEYPVEL